MNPFQIGNAFLYLGDAYQIAPQLGPVDCCVIDPQYKFNAAGAGKFRKARPKGMDALQKAGLNEGFKFEIIDPALYKSVVVFSNEEQIFKLGCFLQDRYRRVTGCAWWKTAPSPMANKSYLADAEPYLHAWNRGGHPLGAYDDLKRITTHPNGKSAYDHPTVKPDMVMDKIMKNVNGETVIDFFMGTGSTGIAALKAGKTFIGIERDPDYFNIAIQRFFGFYAQKNI